MEASVTSTATSERQIKNRALAHNQVAQQWASRRQSTSERPAAVSAGDQQHQSITRQSRSKPPSPPRQQPGSLCYIIGKVWQDTVMGISKVKPAAASTNNNNAAATHSNNTRKKRDKKGKSQARSFPSVLQILQANALHQQVEYFHDSEQGQHRGGGANSTDSTTTQAANSTSLLRVLPQGYNWNQAIVNMAQSRSRAFLLLDLASIVPTLVNWKQICKGIQFLYTVQYNADPKLLQLLLRSQVGLVCTNKWDLERIRQALDELPPSSSSSSSSSNTQLKSSPQEALYDNASSTGKPDGYLRQLILDAQVDTVVVDGPEEVKRIAQALHRMQQRRKNKSTLVKTLKVLLRLPPNTETWETLVQETQQATEGCQKQQTTIQEASLTGISVDISNATSDTFVHVEKVVRKFPSAERVRLDVTGAGMPPTQQVLDWWTQLSTFCHITVDLSHDLISPAGALCTRIIGVKEEQDDATGTYKRHYYIDDGCYGSLYSNGPCSSSSSCGGGDSNANAGNIISNPLPLLYNEQQQDDRQDEEQEMCNYTSTVWGPTCDGLDKVAHDIPLPKLNRDQWLVFPNLGCRIGEGLGTAFNGFAPPDTAYCVLGYFGK